MKNGIPEIAIIGRPNVGKSSLFNMLTRKKKSIIDEKPGITRDRIYEKTLIDNRFYAYFIDTGGISSREKHLFIEEITQSAQKSIEEADLILFVVENPQYCLDDQDIAEYLRKKAAEKTILVVNKVDNEKQLLEAQSFYQIGFPKVVFVSAIHSRGRYELIEVIEEFFRQNNKLVLSHEKVEPQEEKIHLAVIGKPNAGKSSLMNFLLEKDRAIVSPIPGTTMDVIEEEYSFMEKKIVLMDTAGVRRKSKINQKVEYVSVKRSIEAIERCDVAILLIDAKEGVTEQDKKIAGLVLEKGKGLVIGLNKWDLIENEVNKKEFLERMRFLLNMGEYIPMIEISVKTGYQIERLMRKALSIYRNYSKKIATHDLTEFLRQETTVSPLFLKQGNLKIFYVSQKETKPPRFYVSVNHKEFLKENYIRFLQNAIRKRFNFEGVPLLIDIKERK